MPICVAGISQPEAASISRVETDGVVLVNTPTVISRGFWSGDYRATTETT